MYLISNETLESLLKAKLNRRTYDDIDDNKNIIPEEFVEAGIRRQKTAGERKKELDEQIETKEKMMLIINEMIQEEENHAESTASEKE